MAASPTAQTAAIAEPQARAEQKKKIAEAIVAVIAAYTAAVATRRALLLVGLTPQLMVDTLGPLFGALTGQTHAAARAMARIEFTDALPTVGADEVQVERISALEDYLALQFVRNSAGRIIRDLASVALAQPGNRAAMRSQLSKSLKRERTYHRAHVAAMRRRIELRAEEAQVRLRSPEGAYWKLDPTLKTHSADCLAMAGQAWSWSVLSVISPANRHHRCGCRLISLGDARAFGMPGTSRIRTSVPPIAGH